MAINRIVSFLPSATELIYELGAQEKLQGVTHECHYPEDARQKPQVISSVFDPEKMTSNEIDQITTKLMKNGQDIFKLNEENLLNAKPDLIISQNTCEVCAAHTNQINKAVEILNEKPELYSMDPHNLDEIIQGVVEFAELIGKKEQGQELVKSLKERIQKISNNAFKDSPKILAIEWIEPFFTAGHWVPEIISLAGGDNQISKIGEHSRRMKFEEIKKANPDMIILMPCGFDTKRTVLEYENTLKNNSEWNQLSCVKDGNVFAVDANSFFSKPSIRTVTGLEILAKIIHPELFSDVRIPEDSFEQIK